MAITVGACWETMLGILLVSIPTLLFYMQFSAIKKYIPDANIDLLPFGIQKLPDFELNFDTVFSMGVIYHRRDPIEH